MDTPLRVDDGREALLVVLAREGDRGAFAELVERHQRGIRGLLLRCCGDAALADDLAQDAFLRALADLPGLRDPRRFGPWLRRLAVNVWLQHLRRRDHLRGAAPIDDEEGAEPAPGLGRDLDVALASLPEAVRTCVVLAHGEGLTHEEIAEASGLPLGTVKSHLRRGAQRLRERLSDYAGGSP